MAHLKDDIRFEAIADLAKFGTWEAIPESAIMAAVTKWHILSGDWYQEHLEYAESEEGRRLCRLSLQQAFNQKYGKRAKNSTYGNGYR
jgi:hypothetical protein